MFGQEPERSKLHWVLCKRVNHTIRIRYTFLFCRFVKKRKCKIILQGVGDYWAASEFLSRGPPDYTPLIVINLSALRAVWRGRAVPD